MPKKRTSRIYWRAGRAYGDFRDLGGGREALSVDERSPATTDPDVAAKLAADRITELAEKSRNKGLGIEEKEVPALGPYATYHLKQKTRDQEATDAWLEQAENHLKAAVAYFGKDRRLDRIDPEDLTAWVNHLRKQPSRKGGTLSEATIRKMLNSLSNMYARAASERKTTGVGSNPVAAMFSKPTPRSVEAPYLEPEEAAILLESARTYKADEEQGAFQYMYPLLATFLLTGGRRAEILGLEVDDVELKLGKIRIRPNRWRRLKTDGSERAVPLWPQLHEILERYFAEREASGGLGSLLFPAVVSEKEKKKAADEGKTVPETMLVDLRKPLDRIATRAGFGESLVRLHQLRHTYTAARLQTCDRGRPVALYTVTRELGHRSGAMIEKRYGHLHDRAQAGGTEVVEFRVEHYREKLMDRLGVLQAS